MIKLSAAASFFSSRVCWNCLFRHGQVDFLCTFHGHSQLLLVFLMLNHFSSHLRQVHCRETVQPLVGGFKVKMCMCSTLMLYTVVPFLLLAYVLLVVLSVLSVCIPAQDMRA